MTDSSPFSAGQSQPDSKFGLFQVIFRILRPELLYGLLLLLVLVMIGCFYIQAVDTQILGFTHDDGVYAIVGKALSLGKGFKLLHVVGEPGQIKYPFVYPAILALVWLVNPHFPANLPTLNYVTIAFTLASCTLCCFYYRKAQHLPGWLALTILILFTSNFYFIYFFSAVMSEAPYLFFSMLTLWTIFRLSGKQNTLSTPAILLLVVLSSLTFLTRVTGIALMAGIGTWLLLNRQWKNALIYGVGSFLTGVLPWALWIKLNTPQLTDMNFPLVNAYSNYGLELAQNIKAGNYFNDLRASGFSLVMQTLQDMVPLLPNMVKIYPQLKSYPEDILAALGFLTLGVAYLLLGFYLLQVISALRKSVVNGKINPNAFSPPALYLFFYILLITFWNYEDQLARFLTPVVPLLWMFFFKPWARWLPELGQKLPKSALKIWSAVAGVMLTSLLVLWPFSNVYHTIHISRSQHWVESGKYRWMWQEYQTTFSWIKRHLPAKAKLGAASDVVFYLYTNRPTYYVFYASLRRANGKFLAQSIPLLMKSLDYYGVQYLVAEPHMQARQIRYPVNRVAKDLLTQFPKRFKLIYRSPRRALIIYQIVPPAVEKVAHGTQVAL